MSEEQEFERWAAAYEKKFGYFPIGHNMPEPTTELLRHAVETGEEIQPLPIPQGAKS